jgi:dolichol-phosphate mannosyltransferase
MNMKAVVVVPVYNEQRTVISVLDGLRALGSLVDEIVVVDDGSTDNSRQLIAEWSRGQQSVTLLVHPVNRGYSEALLTGFRYALGKLESGQLSPGDVVATVDADGQHDPSQLPAFLKALEEQRVDVVWARRDFSLYPPMKRLGNRIMAMIASPFAGFAFKDVESGYCLFRAGALKDALRFQRSDSRYSLSLTLAIALARLGYKISNDPIASVRIYRSRTSIADGFLDTYAAATTWARVTSAQALRQPVLIFQLALGTVVLLGLLALMGFIALKSIYLGTDSINNYAHIWYISKHLYSVSLPLHFHNLANGKALTYPYAFVPWTLAALFRPVLGDYAVTWTMILGVILVLIVVYRTRLNSTPWLLVLFVLVPFLLEALLNFQMSFVWAMLFGYLYVWALERRTFKWAYFWLVVSAGNHLLIMGPILAGYTAYVYWREPGLRRTLAWLCGFALIPLGPLAWYSLGTPVVKENSTVSMAYISLITIVPRLTLFFSPFFFAKVATIGSQWARHSIRWALAAWLLGLSLWYVPAFAGYGGLFAQAHNNYKEYLQSPVFVPGAVYRVMESSGRAQGQYYFIQRGAVLSHEFFPETQFRKNWTEAGYRRFLSEKSISFVVLSTQYLHKFHKNEGQILESLRVQGLAKLVYKDAQGRFTVYDVRAAGSEQEEARVGELLR